MNVDGATPTSITPGNRWLACFRQLTEEAQSGADSDRILELMVELATNGTDADGSLVFLAGPGGEWLCEAVHNAPAQPVGTPGILGQSFSMPTARMSLFRAGEGLVVAAGHREYPWSTDLGLHGPLMIVPVFLNGHVSGALVLWRAGETPGFCPVDIAPATAFALQAALALDVAHLLQAQETISLAAERERISRDLHDLAIQGLFATGMQLGSLRREITAGASRSRLDQLADEAQASLQDSVSQIRGIVYQLGQQDDASGFIERLRREASNARGHLGFAPALTVQIDGQSVESGSLRLDRDPNSLLEARMSQKADAVPESVREDVVAVVREALTNVAKHAQASSVQVSVDVHGSGPSGEILVTIIDDGSGVDPSHTRESGISNMQRRAILHGGTFAMGAGPRGRGTSLVWRAPIG